MGGKSEVSKRSRRVLSALFNQEKKGKCKDLKSDLGLYYESI